MAAIKTNNGRKGWFLDLSTLDGGPKLDTPIYEKTDEQKARESWVCDICGKSTYEVDYDYIGSGTNHLGCELELEIDKKSYINDEVDETDKDKKVDWFDDADYYTGPKPREKNWSQKKHEDKVFDEVSSVDYYTGPDGHYKKENNNNNTKK